MRDVKALAVWQKARRLALDIYQVSRDLPTEERFGLTAQLRRAAVSCASNIAEGCGREGEPELARYLSMAAGSASEAEYQLLLARDLSYVSAEAHRQLDAQGSARARSAKT